MGQSQPINSFPVWLGLWEPEDGLFDSAFFMCRVAAAIDRLRVSQIKAFKRSGRDPRDCFDWLAAWSLDQDPVAYTFDMMVHEDRQAYVRSLSPAEKEKFIASLRTATELGVVTPPTSGVSGLDA